MKAVKAVVEDGNVRLEEPLDVKGRFEAILVVLDDPWEALIHDSRSRPELVKARQEAQRDYLEGRTTALFPA